MGSPVNGADIISKTENIVAIGIYTPLKRHFDINSVLFPRYIDNIFVQGFFFPTHIGDVFFNTPLITIGFDVGFFGTVIAKGDFNTRI